MHVCAPLFQVRDTQLGSHHSRTDRHVGALTIRASSQQQHFSLLYGDAEREMNKHVSFQKQRVAAVCLGFCACVCVCVCVCVLCVCVCVVSLHFSVSGHSP
jgi:hypothetical protein